MFAHVASLLHNAKESANIDFDRATSFASSYTWFDGLAHINNDTAHSFHMVFITNMSRTFHCPHYTDASQLLCHDLRHQ